MAMIYVSFQKCFNKFSQNYLKKSVKDESPETWGKTGAEKEKNENWRWEDTSLLVI